MLLLGIGINISKILRFLLITATCSSYLAEYKQQILLFFWKNLIYMKFSKRLYCRIGIEGSILRPDSSCEAKVLMIKSGV